MEIRISSKGEYLRPCHIDDLDSLLTITSDTSLMSFMGGSLTREQTRSYIQRFSTSEGIHSENWWIICQKSAMGFVGFIWSLYDSIEKSVSLSIVIKPEFQRQSIESNVLKAWMQYAYEKLGNCQFQIYIPSDHKPSKKIIRSLDMKFKKTLFRKGKSFDLYSKSLMI